MYALLPWKWLSILLVAIIAATIYVDDLFVQIGDPFPDSMIVRFLPVLLAFGFTGFFGPTGYLAPWRIVWRAVPRLNNWFPDLNGIWVGTTNSNWPTIELLVDAATSTKEITKQELYETPTSADAMVVQITNNLFTLRINAYLCSTKSESFSITALPWRDQLANHIHISCVYRQTTPNPGFTDDETHPGAADLIFVDDDFSKAEGTYWTRRAWRTGENTAGTLRLERKQVRKDIGKSFKKHATEYCQAHQQGCKDDQQGSSQDDSSLADQLLKLLWPFQQDVDDDRQARSQDDSSLADRLRKLLPF